MYIYCILGKRKCHW